MASLLDIGMFSYMMMELIHELLEDGNDHAIYPSHLKQSSQRVLSDADACLIPESTFSSIKKMKKTEASIQDDDVDSDSMAQQSRSAAAVVCAICTEEFTMGDRIKTLPTCHHLYHKECIVPWLTRYKRCCPLCMRDV